MGAQTPVPTTETTYDILGGVADVLIASHGLVDARDRLIEKCETVVRALDGSIRVRTDVLFSVPTDQDILNRAQIIMNDTKEWERSPEQIMEEALELVDVARFFAERGAGSDG